VRSLDLVLYLATQKEMHVRQMDIVTAYLNSNFQEEVFMQVSKTFKETLEFIIQMESNSNILHSKVTRMLNELHDGNNLLKKSLYDLC